MVKIKELFKRDIFYFLFVFLILYYIFFNFLSNSQQINSYKIIIITFFTLLLYYSYVDYNNPDFDLQGLDDKYKFFENLIGENNNLYKNPILLNFFYDCRKYYIYDRKNFKDALLLACKLIAINNEYYILRNDSFLTGTNFLDNMKDISRELINTFGSIVYSITIHTEDFSNQIIRLQKIIYNYVNNANIFINDNIANTIDLEVDPNDNFNKIYSNNNFNYYL